MYPDPRFRWDDEAELRAFAQNIGLATICAATPGGPCVAYAPVIIDNDRLRFHLSNANPLTAHLDGAVILCIFLGPHGYVSPDWYDIGPDEVPTWNYTAVEVDGLCRRLDAAALLDQIDALSAQNEARLAPKLPWNRAKADSKKMAAMAKAITGFEVAIGQWRGTRKLGQNKSAKAKNSAIRAIAEFGNHALAQSMRDAT